MKIVYFENLLKFGAMGEINNKPKVVVKRATSHYLN